MRTKTSVDFREVRLLEGVSDGWVQVQEQERERALSREREIVRLITRLRAVAVEQIGGRFEVCPPSTPTQQGVENAIEGAHAEDVVRVFELRREAR